MDVDVEKVIREYMPPLVHLSLATAKDNTPWICEVHFAYDDNLNLYFRSLASRRHSQEIAANPQVAGNIIKQHMVGEPGVGVYFEGTATMLPPGDEQRAAFQCIKARLQTSDDILAEAARPDGHQFYKISVENWYVFGKFGGEKGQKYTLPWAGAQRRG